MPNSLRGPLALEDHVIDDEISRESAGAYVLEESRDLVRFHVTYVGRSDRNINNQLHVHVGSYKRFQFQYCSSAEEAFQEECNLYHHFEPRDNPVHPRRQPGTTWKCPQCKLLG